MGCRPISIAVLDIGTSNIRTTAVNSEGIPIAEFRTTFSSVSPTQGFVEFDAEALFQSSFQLLRHLIKEHDCRALAITNQRASVVVFNPENNAPVTMGQSWQDLRTAPICLQLKQSGISLAPNQSATKIALILDLFDPSRSKGLLAGTIDTWVAYRLTGEFVTDHTNAAMTGLVKPDATKYDDRVLKILNIPTESLPQIQPSIGYFGTANIDGTVLPLVAILGDQQASMLGQAVIEPGQTKATFGTGAMVDLVTGEGNPISTKINQQGTFPIVSRSQGKEIVFGLEAIGLHAGSAIRFACENLALAPNPTILEELANSVTDSEEVLFVPALTGLATPHWDFGALGAFTNLTQKTSRAHLARAVLEGVAHLGADLIEAVEKDTGECLNSIKVDGGMTNNGLFLRSLANFTQKRLEICGVTEATSLGAGFAGLLAIGAVSHISDLQGLIRHTTVVTPDTTFSGRTWRKARTNWQEAIQISRNSVPELSKVSF